MLQRSVASILLALLIPCQVGAIGLAPLSANEETGLRNKAPVTAQTSNEDDQRISVEIDLYRNLRNLAISHMKQGNWNKAVPLLLETIKILRNLAKSDPSHNPVLADVLWSLGDCYNQLGQSYEARQVLLQAESLYQELAKGNKNYMYSRAITLNSLAQAYSNLDQQKEALEVAQEALGLIRGLEDSNPVNISLLAVSLTALSNIYNAMGSRTESARYAKEAVDVNRELAASRPDPFYQGELGGSLHNLGARLSALGQFEEALEYSIQAVRILKQTVKSDPSYLGTLGEALASLGLHLSVMNRHKDALVPAHEAEQILQKLVLDNNGYIESHARSLNNLGIHYSNLGDNSNALLYSLQAVAISQSLADVNPSSKGVLASSLHNLGVRLLEARRPQESLTSFQKAITIWRKQVEMQATFQESLARSLTMAALINIQEGRTSPALTLLSEGIQTEVSYLRKELPLLPEGQRQKMVAVFSGRWQIPFSLANQSEAGANLALFTRLNRHGLLLDIQRSQALLARNGSWQPLLAQIRSLKAQLSSPTLPEPQRLQLQGQLEHSEQELYRQLPQLKPQLVEPIQVARRLPADGVLVEFQRFRPLEGSGPRFADTTRYLALVLTPNGSITAVPLGDAKELDASIQKALRLVGEKPGLNSSTARQAMQALAEVRRRLLDPLAPHIASARQLYLSPDGEINNVPLAALPISDSDPLAGPTLGEQKSVILLTTGRDLLPPRQAATSPSQAPLVMADPDYNAFLPAAPTAAASSTPQTRSGDSLRDTWAPLSNTKAEGDVVRTLLAGTLLQGPQATTIRLQQVQAPLIVHIATHGFFLPDQPRDLKGDDPFHSLTRLELPLLQKEDPLLRSGIVLAGANHPTANPSDDGRLTALEATALSLEGTELVTLSACSTGLGSNATGEGVYGLQRALRVAGARSTLLSLWKVDDAATRKFMENYYLLLQQGVGRGEALRQVQRQIRNETGLEHPRYWAAWQLSGDGGPLQGSKATPQR